MDHSQDLVRLFILPAHHAVSPKAALGHPGPVLRGASAAVLGASAEERARQREGVVWRRRHGLRRQHRGSPAAGGTAARARPALRRTSGRARSGTRVIAAAAACCTTATRATHARQLSRPSGAGERQTASQPADRADGRRHMDQQELTVPRSWHARTRDGG